MIGSLVNRYVDIVPSFQAGGSSYVKLQIYYWRWNGFDFYYVYLDRIYRIIRNFFACGEVPFGRRPYYPDDPVDPVQFLYLKIGIHSSISFKN